MSDEVETRQLQEALADTTRALGHLPEVVGVRVHVRRKDERGDGDLWTCQYDAEAPDALHVERTRLLASVDLSAEAVDKEQR